MFQMNFIVNIVLTMVEKKIALNQPKQQHTMKFEEQARTQKCYDSSIFPALSL